ncbi:hypothetical protein BLSTO_02292 [Blastocystis sp. subtype 1]
MYSLLTIAIYSIGVFALTLLTTSLPLLVHMSKKTSKVINLIGIGLMMGTAFIVVIPEAVLHGCECPVPVGTSGSAATEEHHLEAKNIGLAMVFGFITMMVTDSLSHGSGDDHNHGDHQDNETCSDHGKEEVVINMSENGVKRLRTSISGLCLHSLFDGLAIGSSISSGSVEVIQTIFGAILLHKVSASLGVGIFIKQLHVPFNQAFRYIAVFSAATPVSTVISAFLIHVGSSFIPTHLLGYAFAYSAGTFLHVALMHMLPSIGHHLGISQIAFLLIGVFIPYLLFVEHSH